jgi:hypothetical protein
MAGANSDLLNFAAGCERLLMKCSAACVGFPTELDTEQLGQSRSAGRRQPERTTPRHALEPCEFQQAVENGGSDQALEVTATLGPVETRLAENSRPRTRREVGTEHAEELFARTRELAAFIGEHDLPHRDQRVRDGDAGAASQMIVATSGKPDRLDVCRPRPMTRRNLDGGDELMLSSMRATSGEAMR